jgi:hypothetical protein
MNRSLVTCHSPLLSALLLDVAVKKEATLQPGHAFNLGATACRTQGEAGELARTVAF